MERIEIRQLSISKEDLEMALLESDQIDFDKPNSFSSIAPAGDEKSDFVLTYTEVVEKSEKDGEQK